MHPIFLVGDGGKGGLGKGLIHHHAAFDQVAELGDNTTDFIATLGGDVFKDFDFPHLAQGFYNRGEAVAGNHIDIVGPYIIGQLR